MVSLVNHIHGTFFSAAAVEGIKEAIRTAPLRVNSFPPSLSLVIGDIDQSPEWDKSMFMEVFDTITEVR